MRRLNVFTNPSRLSGLCLYEPLDEWVPFEEYTIYQKNTGFPETSEKKRDIEECFQRLSVNFNELQLIRLEQRPFHHKRKWKEELWFGDIHTKTHRRARYRPSALQTHSLVRASQIENICKTCRKVNLASSKKPPRLNRRFFLPVSLEGEWISRRCETRPNTLFLMRRIKFINENRTWEGVYSYFSEERCSKVVFKIQAKGKFLKKGKSNVVDGGTNFDFKIKEAILTAETKSLSDQLNGLPRGTCGKVGEWRVGFPQDVTPTGGCAGLGLSVPVTELDLIKMEPSADGKRLLLSLGQTDTDAAVTRDKEYAGRRPSSYQPSLIQCRLEDKARVFQANRLFPALSQLKSTSKRESHPSKASLDHRSLSNYIQMGIVLLFISFYH